MQVKKVVRSATLAMLFGFLVVSFSNADSALAQAKQKLVVQLDWTAYGMHSALHLAKRKGWFDEAGLDVTINDGKGSATTLQQIASGEFDVGFVHLGATAAAISKGLPVISIMGIMRSSDFGFLVPADSGWKGLHDLKGKRLVVAASAGVATYLDPSIKAAGMSRSDFEIISVDISALAPTFTSNQADAMLTAVASFGPIVSRVRKTSAVLLSSTGIVSPGYGFIVRRADVDAKAAALKKFIAVNQRAWKYIIEGHQEEAADAVMAERPEMRLNRDILIEGINAHLPFFDTPATKDHPIGWQAESDWAAALKTMQEVGMTKPEIKPADVFTNKLVPDGQK